MNYKEIKCIIKMIERDLKEYKQQLKDFYEHKIFDTLDYETAIYYERELIPRLEYELEYYQDYYI